MNFQTPSKKPRKFDRADFEKQFPIADYNAPEPKDTEKLRKTQEKKNRYDNKHVLKDGLDGQVSQTSITSDWEFYLPALPVAESDAVVVGEV